jgi:hypothetical protein
MAEWLSEEWLQEVAAGAASRPPVPGVTGTVSVAVTGAASGDAVYHWSYRDGVPGDGARGAAGDADLALVITQGDARPVAAGEVEASVAFMRGRLKATGDGALLLGVLASTATEEYRAWRQKVMDPTDPGPAHR